jgi:hypothetical protein
MKDEGFEGESELFPCMGTRFSHVVIPKRVLVVSECPPENFHGVLIFRRQEADKIYPLPDGMII